MDAFIQSVLEMGAGPSTSFNQYPGNRRRAPPHAAAHTDNRPPEQRPAPPASRRAIRQLPTVVVKPEDLVDESNRECCICLDEHNLGDRVVRLPCAHIFHPRCITDWLLKHCTCPVCRYELPTNDPSYEPLRMERMKNRRPRYAQYELARMSVGELRNLVYRLNMKNCEGIVERSELMKSIVASGKIDIIAAPDPVEYKNVSELRGMGVGKLKRAMEDAGVFFDPIDVVEKEDMVQIFVNSGRVVFCEEEKVEEVQESGDPYGGLKIASKRRKSEDSIPETEGDLGLDAENVTAGEGRYGDSEAGIESPGHVYLDDRGDDMEMNESQEMGSDGPQSVGVPETTAQTSVDSTYGGHERESSSQSAFATRSVSELKALARQLGVNISDCIEKGEMVERIAQTVSQGVSG
mmetsp:Transcript_12432/g.25810  ORF Transcript_12432/g.25810 Transcript_12432/m.25810 type:complete len:407 (-) Transcript_12432:168-1388(-)